MVPWECCQSIWCPILKTIYVFPSVSPVTYGIARTIPLSNQVHKSKMCVVHPFRKKKEKAFKLTPIIMFPVIDYCKKVEKLEEFDPLAVLVWSTLHSTFSFKHLLPLFFLLSSLPLKPFYDSTLSNMESNLGKFHVGSKCLLKVCKTCLGVKVSKWLLESSPKLFLESLEGSSF